MDELLREDRAPLKPENRLAEVVIAGSVVIGAAIIGIVGSFLLLARFWGWL